MENGKEEKIMYFGLKIFLIFKSVKGRVVYEKGIFNWALEKAVSFSRNNGGVPCERMAHNG